MRKKPQGRVFDMEGLKAPDTRVFKFEEFPGYIIVGLNLPMT